MRIVLTTLLLLSFLSNLPAQSPTGLASAPAFDIFLGGIGFDIEVDDGRGLIYVSVPSLNEIKVISASTFQVVGQISPGISPRGIDMSADGLLLYVALHGSSSVAIVDLNSLATVQTVILTTELGAPQTWDVVEGNLYEVFVTSNPSSSGFAYVVKFEVFSGAAPMRVADNRIIRAGPRFAKNTNGNFRYLGEGFSPNSMYKIDISLPLAPVVAEDAHGTVSGTQNAAVDPAETQIYLSSNQVLSTGSIGPTGVTSSGSPGVSRSGLYSYSSSTPGSIQVYDTSTFALVETITFPSLGSGVLQIDTLSGDAGVMTLVDDRLSGRAFPVGTVCSFPGSGEGLVLATAGSSLGCKDFVAGGLLTVEVDNPAGNLIGTVPALLAQVHVAPLSSPTGFPEVHVDLSQPDLFVLFDGNTSGGFGSPTLLPPQGLAFAYQIPTFLIGFDIRVQAIALTSTALNGFFVASDAHELSITGGPPPVINSVAPVSAAAGDLVTLTGTNFTTSTTVSVAGMPVTPASVTSTSIQFTMPTGAGCDTLVEVTDGFGGAPSGVMINVTPVVTSVINSSGPSAGGTNVIILGLNFGTPGSVSFDGIPAAVVNWSPNVISCTSPAGAVGASTITITTNAVCQATTSFTYVP